MSTYPDEHFSVGTWSLSWKFDKCYPGKKYVPSHGLRSRVHGLKKLKMEVNQSYSVDNLTSDLTWMLPWVG